MRVKLDPAEAARLYREGLTVLEVSERLGVNYKTVADSLNRQGVVRRPTGPRNRIDALLLAILFHVEGRSQEEIAEELGTSEKEISRKLIMFGLKQPGTVNARRLTVNPEPLRVVKARPGGPAEEPEYLLCRRTREGDLVAASIHREGCTSAPDDQALLADGSVWHVELLDRSRVDQAFAQCCDQGAEPKVSCVRCGGWWRR